MASVDESASSAHFDSLPVELLDDIFSRLPLQSLFSVRDVCSRWRAVIENNAELEDRLYLMPQPSRYHGKYTTTGDPEARSSTELQLYRQNPGTPAPSVYVRHTSTYAIRILPIGHMNEDFFDTGYEGRVPDGESTFSLAFKRDPRQNDDDDVYMGAYQSILVAQPPQTSMELRIAFRDGRLLPEDSPTQERLIQTDFEYTNVPLNGIEETGIIRRVEVWNLNGIRLGDVIREIDQAEAETGGHFDWQMSNIEIPDLKCLSAADIHNNFRDSEIGSLYDLDCL